MKCIVQVKNKNNIQFLYDYGDVTGIPRMGNLVLMQVNEHNLALLESHPEVVDIRETGMFSAGFQNKR